mgnify:FL=1
MNWLNLNISNLRKNNLYYVKQLSHMPVYNLFMVTEELYSLAERKNIGINFFRIRKKGFTTKLNGNYEIGLSIEVLASQIQEKEALAEELAHCLTGTVYQFTWITSHVGQLNIAKAENKAQKTAAALLVPLERLKELSYLSVAEIAEELNVSEKIVSTAIEYYRLKGLL